MLPEREQTVLTEGVIWLRSPGMDEAEAIYEAIVETGAELEQWMTWYHADYLLGETESWLRSLPNAWTQRTNFGFTIYSAEGRVLGGCGLNHINSYYRYANLGYWVRSSSRGQGVAARAALLTARFGFEQLQMLRAEIVVAEGNVASLRVAEKCGAQREGILRNRILTHAGIADAVMHSLIPQDFGLTPA